MQRPTLPRRFKGGAFHAPEWLGFPSKQAENKKADMVKNHIRHILFVFGLSEAPFIHPAASCHLPGECQIRRRQSHRKNYPACRPRRQSVF